MKKIFKIENDLGANNFRGLLRYTFFLVIIFIVTFFLVFLFLLEPKKKYRLINFANMDVLTAIKWLDERNLEVGVFRSTDPFVKKFEIISQRPEPGMEVKSGRKVTLVVSDGPNDIEMPLLVGKPFRDARKTLYSQLSGNNTVPEILKVEEYSDGIDKGFVTRHTPSASQKVNLDEEIILYVSKGPSLGEYEVKNYLLESYNEVYQELVENDVRVRVNYFPAERAVDVGKIFSQSIEAGEPLSQGDSITFDVGIRKDELSEDFVSRDVETLRVASFLLPPSKTDDFFLNVSAVVSDSRGETAIPPILFEAAKTITFPFKTLGSGSLKILVEEEFFREFYF